MVRVQFADVVQQDNQYVILLLEKEAQKLLGIWTGFTEGTMIAWLAKGKPHIWDGPKRPSTMRFATELLTRAGVTFRGTAIRSVRRNIYLGVVQVLAGDQKRNLDARPSDAIALALEMNLPIFSDPRILAESGWSLDSVYRRITMGKTTDMLVQTLKAFWLAQDSSLYLNSVLEHSEVGRNAEKGTTPAEVHLVDVLRVDELETRLVFWHKDSKRMLPIRTTSWEAASLAWLAGGQPAPSDRPKRPQTYQLIASIMQAAGIILHNAQIRDLREGVVYAGVEAQAGDEILRIDARPVDAVGLALATGAPIFVSEGVLGPASLPPNLLYRSRGQIGRGLRNMVAELKNQADGPGSRSSILQRLGNLLGV